MTEFLLLHYSYLVCNYSVTISQGGITDQGHHAHGARGEKEATGQLWSASGRQLLEVWSDGKGDA
jgi:hypothetical protein